MTDDRSDDASLLNAWRAGDSEAGTRLFRRHYDLVVRFFANKIGAQDQPDLIQRTFLGCVEGRDRIRDGDRFRAYLLNIALRQLYRSYEQRRTDRARIDFGTVSVADLDPSPSRLLAARDDQRRLLAAMRGLPLQLQVVLELSYWEGLSATAVAEVVEAPVGTVKTRLRRARALLAKTVAQDTSEATAPTAPEEAAVRAEASVRALAGLPAFSDKAEKA